MPHAEPQKRKAYLPRTINLDNQIEESKIGEASSRSACGRDDVSEVEKMPQDKATIEAQWEPKLDGHAGDSETSQMMTIRLVKQDNKSQHLQAEFFAAAHEH